MILDARELEASTVLDSDVCIVGGGAAGLALAYALRNEPLTITMLESGGLDDDASDAARFAFRNIGPHSLEVSGRGLRLGGGTARWGGNCSLLDREDFTRPENQSTPHWPISFDELDRHTPQVARFLAFSAGSGVEHLRATSSREVPARLPGGEARSFNEKIFLRQPIRLAAAYKEVFTAPGSNLRLVLHATATTVLFAEAGNHVTAIRASTGACGSMTVRARRFILAGGLETVPLLMRALGPEPECARRRLPAIGRYLHAHLLSLWGFLVPAREALGALTRYGLPIDLAKKGKVTFEIREFGGLQVRPILRNELGLLNGVMWFAPVATGAMMPDDVLRTAERFQAPLGWRTAILRTLLMKRFPSVFAIRHFLEQPARWESRLEPSGVEHDPHPEVFLHWQVGEIERMTMQANCELLAQESAMSPAGRILQQACATDRDSEAITRNAHPMGGAIMGDDPKLSVVDRNALVHGISNLYLCGGCVIPRSGASMVTGVILQLAFRLAQHLTEHREPTPSASLG